VIGVHKIILCCAWALSVGSRLEAQTLETESARTLPAHTWEIGDAFEAQTSSEGTERAMPFALGYGVTDRLELLVEPVPYTSIRPKAVQPANGAGDIEITVTYRFHQESRWPAFAVAGEVKVPTAHNVRIGTGQTDYAAYISESKRVGPLDTHAHLSYTFVGQPAGILLGNIIGFGVAAVYPASPRFDVFGELLSNSASTPGGEGSGGSDTTSIAPEAAGGELVTTLGTAWHAWPSVTLYLSGSRDNIGAVQIRTGFVVHFR
jgi:hypothetical protein